MVTKRGSRRSAADAASASSLPLVQSDEQFRVLVESIVDYAIFMLDADGRIISWNTGAERLKGYREDEIVGQHFSRFYPLEAIEQGIPQRELEIAAAKGRFEDEGWRLRKDGSFFWASVVITPVRDSTGHLLGFAKVTRDLTERRLTMQRLEASEARLQAFMNNSRSMMFIKDLSGRYLYVNDPFLEAFGVDRFDVIFRSDREIFPPDVAAQFARNDADALAAGKGVEFEEKARYSDGNEHISIVHKFPMFDRHGQVIALGGVVTDITERKNLEQALRDNNEQLRTAIRTEIALRQRQEHLQRVATQDPLTGVTNRAPFFRRAEHAIAAARRSGALIVLLFIDLDRFKDVNDRLGHAAGDEVLREVASRLSACLREVDAIARHGGDEFIVLLDGIEKTDQIFQVTNRMREELAKPMRIAGREVRVTSSIGIAIYPRDGGDVSTLIRMADVAMYRSKELGRNTVQLYSPEMDTPPRT
jgi:diguanylate cyclase (GGDEF)-like protein/PAS domain S-box-containing protein